MSSFDCYEKLSKIYKQIKFPKSKKSQNTNSMVQQAFQLENYCFQLEQLH